MSPSEFSPALEALVRSLEKLEKEHGPAFGWPEAGLLVALRHAWANYDYEKELPEMIKKDIKNELK